MASDRTLSDDECSSDNKYDSKVADSDYANSNSEQEESNGSEKYITKKDLVSTLKDMFFGSLKRKKGRTDKPVKKQKQKRSKLEHDQDMPGSSDSPKPRSRLNVTYFSNLIEGLSKEQRSIIEKSAFGSLLNFQRCPIPLSFVKWIARHIDVRCSDIVINGRSIPISPNTTSFILGIPNGGLEIKCDSDAGKHFFHSHYGSTKPLISFFGSKLLNDKGVNKLSEDDILRCFMVVALSTFLCPNSDTHPSPKYLDPLIDVKSSSKWNWSKFVYEWLMTYIAKFQKESKSKEQTSKTLGGCGYLLAVNYLDFKDFGIRNLPIGPPPRISVWKGEMIKEYSKMDECTREDFGKHPIKAKEQLSYDVIGSGPHSIEQQGNNSNTSCRDALLQFNGKSFNPKVIEDISSVCEEFTREHSDTTYRTNTQLAAKVLNCVYMSKAQLSIENHSTTPREEKSAERSRQGDRSIASNGNTPPQEQNHTNNIEKIILDRSTFPQKELHSNSNENIALERVICSELQKTPQSKSIAVQKGISLSKTNKTSSKDFVGSQQSHNSVASRTRAKRLYSGSPLSSLSLSPSKKNSADQKIRKAVRKQSVKETRHQITGPPNKEESDTTVEPISTIPPEKQESPKSLETNNSTEFVIDIEGPYDAEEITPNTTDKTKFILVNYSNSSEEYKGQDPTQEGSDGIPSNNINQPNFECLHHFDDKPNTNKSASLGHFLSQTTSGTNNSMQGRQKEIHVQPSKTCTNDKHRLQHVSGLFLDNSGHLTANMDIRRPIGQCCEGQDYQDDFVQFLYEQDRKYWDPSDDNEIAGQWGHAQIYNEQNSPQLSDCNNTASIRTPAPKQVIPISSHSSPDIVMNSPRTAKSGIPNPHAGTEERQYSMTRIIDSLKVSGSCCESTHNLHRPKRIVHPSKYKSSPYDNCTRHQTISAAELNHYNNILSIGNTQEHKFKFVVSMDNVKVTWSSLSKSLAPRGVVDTYVLNAYAKKISNDQDNNESEYRNFYFFHRTSVYFLKNWRGAGREEDFKNCARQAFLYAKNKRPLHYHDLLIFPCLYDNHWFVFTVDIKGHHFVFLDSMYDENHRYQKNVQGLLIPGFITMWEESSNVAKDFSKFDIQYPQITRQTNNHDCGIYAMKCMEFWNPRIHLKDMIRPEYIPNMRKQIANDLLFSQYNSQEEAKVLATSFKATEDGKYARQQ